MRQLNRFAWKKWPLTVKLTVAMTTLIVIVVASVTLLAIRREQQTFQAELQRQAELLLATLTAAVTDPLYTLDADALSDTVETLGFQALSAEQQILASGRVYNAEGMIIADAYDPLLAFSLESDPFGQRLLNSNTTVFDWRSDQLVAGRAVLIGRQQLGAVSVGLSTAPLEAKVAAVRNQGLGIALATVIIGVLLALLLSRSITGPLQELMAATQRIADGDLTQKITVSSGDELAVLGTAMERMRAELRTLYSGLEQQVTERTQELGESEARFRQVVSSISDHIYMTEITQDGQYINRYLSPNVEDLTGYPLEKFIADWSFWPTRVIHPDDQAIAAAQAERLAKHQNSEIEYRLVRADGSIIWVRDSGRVEKDTASQSILVFGVVSDITERKRAEEALRQQQAFLQQVIDIQPLFVFVRDQEGRFKLANQAIAEAYGTTVEELLGKTDADFNPDPGRVEHILRGDRAVLDRLEEKFISEEQITDTTGQTHWLQIIKRPIVDEDGVARQVLGVAADITDRKRVEDAIAMARDQAIKANEFKTQLLANVSHDLRTPLGAILGYTEMIQEGIYGPISDEQQEITQKITTSIRNLTSMINDLLDQTSLETDAVTVVDVPFKPKVLIDHMKSTMQVLAKNKGLQLTTDIATDVPTTLFGDPGRLQQILNNLVSNALKFTEQGSVQVRIYRPDEVHWAMQVSDTGPGIPLEAQAYIFEAFRQVDGSVTRKHGGSGLGLSIVKQLASLMGGQVTLESTVGQGSTFTVLLPLTPVQERIS